MKKVNLEMTIQEYAEVREGLAYLAKQLRIDPHLRDDCTMTAKELDGLLSMMGEQLGDIELVQMLVAEGRQKKASAE